MSNHEKPRHGKVRMAWNVKPIWLLALIAPLAIPIVAFLLWPSIREGITLKRNICVNNMHLLAMALHNYQSTYGRYPPAYLADSQGKPMHSWRVFMLPYLERKDLFDQYDFSEPWDGPNNRRLHDKMPDIYRCPSAGGKNFETNYVAVVGAETLWPRAKSTSFQQIGDWPPGETIMLVETADSGINWLEPRDLSFEEALRGINPKGQEHSISSRHPGTIVAFAGTNIRILDDTFPIDTLRALLTINGGESVTLPAP